jgi:very-short-patch-repair endonuclease
MKQNPLLTERARALRREMTPSEKILWACLRDRRFAGFKFRRQKPMVGYILDFYCAAASLVVEPDGESHLGKEESDKRRQAALERLGLRVLRFWDTQLFEERESVMEVIWRECQARKKTTKEEKGES